MSKKIKLKLDDLKVQSFVTLENREIEKMKGGWWTDDPGCDFPTINDSCFSWCDDMCNDFPTGCCLSTNGGPPPV